MADSSQHLLAVRHPPVAVTGVCYGRAEVPLADPEGAAVGLLAAIEPRGLGFDTIWSSPSARCAGPARSIAARLGGALRIDPRLSEISFGAWEGLAWSEIERDAPAAFSRWMTGWLTEAPPDGETIGTFEARVASWAAELTTTSSHLLVAHAGCVRALRVIAGRATWRQAMEAGFPPLAAEWFSLPVR